MGQRRGQEQQKKILRTMDSIEIRGHGPAAISKTVRAICRARAISSIVESPAHQKYTLEAASNDSNPSTTICDLYNKLGTYSQSVFVNWIQTV
jgi:hypothetical protein